MLAHTQPLRNLRNRVAPLSDLAHSVTVKLFTEIRPAHDALLASNLGKKTSTNLGAIHVTGFASRWTERTSSCIGGATQGEAPANLRHHSGLPYYLSLFVGGNCDERSAQKRKRALTYNTPQENFWAGEFGDTYVDRNDGGKLLASKISMFSKILARTHDVKSVRELGANIGLNMLAFKNLLPAATLQAIEINEIALARLSSIEGVDARLGSLLDDHQMAPVDMAFIAGVLIHINPDALETAYQRLWESSKRYIVMAEYYNPSPTSITYRGHEGRLFKRDFAGEMMDKYPSLKLVDYGFVYHRDPVFPGDDLTWFVMEK
ncbi:pseudaminic acid biosynthesis-associated methylase [Shinella sp.]|uniref:pseudaminic acid biosynthesis-associated methylase n=1 Tax=Shinella sp. TaxID=1870904 RepID=UPI0040368AD4